MSHSHKPVAIIGAGPYGLSIATHMRSAGVDFRIFGKPMYRWQQQMPKGMLLKSEGCSSNLSHPTGDYTLGRFCGLMGWPYADRSVPVPLDVFTQYALWFQRRFVPKVENLTITGVSRSADGFEVCASDGITMRAGQVIVATGLDYAAQVPKELGSLPPELRSHTGDHNDVSRFEGRDVVVIGAGQSALETSALLAEAGASVRLLVRGSALRWNSAPSSGRRSRYSLLTSPASKLGEGLGLWFYANAPMAFRHLPQRLRLERVRTTLGPSGAWWLKERVVGRVQILLEHTVRAAANRGEQVLLQVTGQDGQLRDLITDHVVCATGYRFDLERLPFLNPALTAQIRTIDRQPVLSSSFESTVRGLYFTGVASSYSFGPVMRFLHGADYTARCLTRQVIAKRRWVAVQSLYRPVSSS